MSISKIISDIQFYHSEKMRLIRLQNYSDAVRMRNEERNIIRDLGYDYMKVSISQVIEDLKYKRRTEIINDIIE